MADDVKVKFGGDFTDVAKGAGDAVSKAGSALTSWFGDFKKSTEASILSSLALSSIFGKFTQGVAESLKYFRELDLTMRRFNAGAGGGEMQHLAKYAGEVGVSMETVGRTMNYFSKLQKSATAGNVTHIASLKGLKFTDDEIRKGNISSIEVLKRLSQVYDETGQEAWVAGTAIQLFGTKGAEMMPIIKGGAEQLNEFVKSLGTYSDETVRKMSEMQKQLEKFKRTLADMFINKPLELLANASSEAERSAVFGSVTSQSIGMTGKFKAAGGGTIAQQSKSDAAQIAGELGNSVDAIKETIKYANKQENMSLGVMNSPERKEYFKTLAADLQAMIAKAEAKPKEEAKTPPLLDTIKTMSASSLQAIGGGDITSVLAGTYQTSMLDAAKATAENTRRIAEADNAPKKTITSVAK
ncbi:hypothetical protein UFOVP1118_33 [uncultured Caudovirales phage]|uniref:Uncharacterized protein n=1 Tax=uncultured Caudovirales phage TaxID=2100421 RepID=A0A6J5QMQ0_9CAUD|nr:hypothetical protein UFOVP1118_33 [uncultured Caudovirales phage]